MDKAKLWYHAFPFGVDEKVICSFEIEKVEKNEKVEKDLNGEQIEWTNQHLKKAKKAVANTIYVDTAKPPGKAIVLALVVSDISEKFARKIRNKANIHYSLRRNFKRKAHPHHPNSYYSEVGHHFQPEKIQW